MNESSSSHPRQSEPRLHVIERESRGHYSVRIATPHYDREDPYREISAGWFGWFQGTPRGIIIRARVDDLRAVGRALTEAADWIERDTEFNDG